MSSNPEGPALVALHRYTALESPTGHRPSLDALATVLEADATAVGLHARRERYTSGDHLVWTRPAWKIPSGRPLVFLTHYDTVWPVGTLAEMPWSVDGDVVRGPGVYDAKAGIVALLAAVGRVIAADVPHPEICILVIADEETGSATAHDLVSTEALRARAVLGLEPPHPGGALKTGRRGSTRARVEVTGVEAHAALDPGAGVNAIDELLDQLVRLPDVIGRRPVLLNTGTIAGGGRTNVLAGHAHADLGLRFGSPEDEQFVLAALGTLSPFRTGAEVRTHLLSHRPTWRPDAAGDQLLARVAEIGAGIGQRLTGRPADGAADTNTTGALGRPTIDGLGPRGGGAHARGEWVSVSGIGERTELLAALIAGLHRCEPPAG